jgi:hypothetical protein
MCALCTPFLTCCARISVLATDVEAAKASVDGVAVAAARGRAAAHREAEAGQQERRRQPTAG